MPGSNGRLETDSHADTCCAGSNCVVLEFTNSVVDVFPYHKDLGKMASVPIATVATLVTDKEGQQCIFVINEALWFGPTMKNSLISTNQVRSYDVQLWDNPCDPFHPPAIHNTTTTHLVPLEFEGIVAFVESRAPTDKELDHLPLVHITSDVPWHPDKASYRLHHMENGHVTVQRTVSSAVTSKEATESSSLIPSVANPGILPSLSSDDWCSPDFSVVHNQRFDSRFPYFDVSTPDSNLRSISCVYSTSFADEACLHFPHEQGLATLMRTGGFKVMAQTRSQAKLAPVIEEAVDESVRATRRIEYRPEDFSKTRHSLMKIEDLMEKWNISKKCAEKTMRCTRQEGTRSAKFPLARQYRTGNDHNKFNQLDGDWYADVFFNSVISSDGHTCAVIFYSGEFCWTMPLRTKKDVAKAIKIFCREIGIMKRLTTDGAKEFAESMCDFRSFLMRHGQGIVLKHTSREQQRHNKAETGVKLIKNRVYRTMEKEGVHPRLWQHCLAYETDIFNRIWRPQQNRTGCESVNGNTPDISEFLDFKFYGWVWWWDLESKRPKLGRWLGCNRNVGQALASYVLKANGQIITSTTVQNVTVEDALLPPTQRLMKIHDANVGGYLDRGTSTASIDDEVDAARVLDAPDEEFSFDIGQPEEDTHDVETYDEMVGAAIEVNRGGEAVRGHVIGRTHDDAGNLVGKHHPNPLVNTSKYSVEYEDGSKEELSSNIIAEAIFAKVDDEGREYLLLDSIIDHKRDESVALNESNGFNVKSNGTRVAKQTTQGWKFLLRWKDNSENWVDLKDLKESNPLEVADYVQGHGLLTEPAFAWWVPHSLKKRERIISKLSTSKYWRTTEKLGITVPRSIEQAYKLDEENSNTLWQDAIAKEMHHVLPAFSDPDISIDKVKERLIGYQRIRCHLIFDIKMDFTRKARFVAGGHVTDPPDCMTYSSVVSRETVRIAFLLAALNDLDVCAADIGNAYLNADCAERIYTVAGKEFGKALQGRVLIVSKALYGLKSSGAAWRKHLSGSIKEMGFTPSRGDPDLYFRAACKPDGTEYYEYLLVYVDDILCISHNTKPVMDKFAKIYRLKADSVGPPERYLGADVEKTTDASGVEAWAMSPDSYIRNSLKVVEGYMDVDNVTTKKATCPFHHANYHPELEDTALLGPAMIARYQQLIGILRWGCELGRLDILHEVALMSAFNAAPRQGHLDAVYHIFSYLKSSGPRCLFFDPTEPVFDVEFNDDQEWKEFYEIEEEPTPSDMPKPRGKKVVMTCWVDASHASNKLTMRSHTGIFIKLNGAPIAWYSKRQNTVESSTFGSEFVALRVATEMCQALRYKLRMFGVAIDGPTSVMCDNKSVQTNASVPTSQLGKKHNAICYHKVRENVAAGVIRVGWVSSENNLADLFTKVLNRGVRNTLLEKMMTRWRNRGKW